MSGGGPGVLETARQQAGFSALELWVAYFAVGGLDSLDDVEAVLAGRAQAGRREYDRLAQALNDRFTDMDLDHPVPYFDELGG